MKKESYVAEMDRKRQEWKVYDADPKRKYGNKPCLTCSVLKQCLEARKTKEIAKFTFCEKVGD